MSIRRAAPSAARRRLLVEEGGFIYDSDAFNDDLTVFRKGRRVVMSNQLGVKGAGEGPIIPIGGLMANAVANALASFGAMPNQLPLSPARVWHMGSVKQSTDRSG